MQIGKLDHVNIRTTILEEMIDWYTLVLGMKQGKRPDFPFPGAWLYTGESPAVHLIGIEEDNSVGSESKLKLEHFAFKATGAASFEEKLNQLNEPFRRSDQKAIALIQYNVWDPDGNHIHIDFSADE